MFAIIGRLWFLYFSVCIFVFARGIMGSYIPLRADIEGFSITAIGMLQGITFFGLALGGMLSLHMIRKVGHVRTFGVCLSLVSVAPLIQATEINFYSWIFAQIIFGYGTAGVYVVIEAWINHACPNEHRGKVFSIYSLLLVTIYALSPFLIKVVDNTQATLFLIASIVSSLAFLPVALVAQESPEHEYSERISFQTLYKRSPYGVKGILLALFAIGVFQSVFIIYAIHMGFDSQDALLAMVLFGIGSALATYPLGWVSDRMDRRIVICFASFCGVLGCVMIVYAGIIKDTQVLWIGVFVLGAFLAPLHPLITSHINDRLKQHEMSSVAAWLILAFAIMGGLGAIIVGMLMDKLGIFIMPWVLTMILFINTVYCLYAIRTRKSVSEQYRGDFVGVTTMSTTSLRQGAFDSDEAYESNHGYSEDSDNATHNNGQN